MATNPKGKGTKTIGINMKREIAEELERRATSCGLSTGAYIKFIVNDWIDNDRKLQIVEK